MTDTTSLVKDLNKALLQCPKDNARIAEAWVNMGNYYFNSNNNYGAQHVYVLGFSYNRLQCYTKALEYGYTHPEAWRKLGNSLVGTVTVLGCTYTAEQCYGKALEYDSTDPDTWYWMGNRLNGITDTVNGYKYNRLQCYAKALEYGHPYPNTWEELSRWMTTETVTVTVCGIEYTKEECATIGKMTKEQWILVTKLLAKGKKKISELQTLLEASKQETIHLSEVKVGMEAKYNDDIRKHQDEVIRLQTLLQPSKQDTTTIHLSEKLKKDNLILFITVVILLLAIIISIFPFHGNIQLQW